MSETNFKQYLGSKRTGVIEFISTETAGQKVIDEFGNTHWLFSIDRASNAQVGDKVELVYRSYIAGTALWYAHVIERAPKPVLSEDDWTYAPAFAHVVSPVPPAEVPAAVPAVAAETAKVEETVTVAPEQESTVKQPEINWDTLNKTLEEASEKDEVAQAHEREIEETEASIKQYADRQGVNVQAVKDVLVNETVPVRPKYAAKDLMRLRDAVCQCGHKGKDHKRYVDECNRCSCQYFDNTKGKGAELKVPSMV